MSTIAELPTARGVLRPRAMERMAQIGLGVFSVVLGCSNEPPPDRAHLAESVGITLAACLPGPFGSSGSPVRDIETELNLGGEVVWIQSANVVLDAAALDCVYRAGADCDAARACLGVQYRATETCEGAGFGCSVGQLVTCTDFGFGGSAFRTAVDCAASGRVCIQSDEVTARCAEAPCEDDGTFVTRCLDDRHMETCGDGALVRGTCRPGSMCSAEFGTCVGAGDACVGDVCDGDVLVPCEPINHRTTTPIDCAGIGLRCEELPSLATANCVPVASECEPTSSLDVRCEGDTLVYCGVDARLRRYDCAAHGYLGCDPTLAICRSASPPL